ncbi:autotransporter outer membrane beta-barrel domain-containing protein [Polynucleobacter paneuropaeus]|nr:autotransporter outer membrane beta-barrel domain-containing protein [Polynucleobacter paneuropaeus]
MKIIKIYALSTLFFSATAVLGAECDPTLVISSSCSITRNDLGTYSPATKYGWDGGSINVNPATPTNFNISGNGFFFLVGPTGPASVGSLLFNSNTTIDFSGNPILISGGASVDSIVNNGTLNSSGDYTVFNSGTANNFTNNGTISSSGNSAIFSGAINNLTNNGTISSSAGMAITQITTINNLINTGTISSSNSNAIMLLDGSTIGSLNNSGIIQGSSSAIYFTTANFGGSAARIDALVNSGTIQALNGNGIDLNSGSISSISSIGVLTNTGTILGGIDNYAISVDSLSSIQTLNNLQGGTISSSSGDGLNNSGTITNLNNAGLIRSFGPGGHYGVINSGTISNLNNSGAISGLNIGLYNNVGATISVLTNANGGSIGGGGTGITNSGDIGVLINSGQISSAFSTGLSNAGTIGALSNIGSIRAPFGNMISNSGTITTLNNAQGTGDTTPLTYTRNLPQNYNIILGSNASTYGKLAVTSATSWDGGSGTTNFGIYSGLVKSTKYTAVISGVTASLLTSSSLTGTYSSGGKSYAYSLTLESGSSDTWDLLFPTYYSGPSVANTNQSLVNTASALQGTYTLQNSVLANSFSYDCTVFGANDVCVSAGGRNTQVQAANGPNNTSALLIAAYRPHPNYRVGAYADQNLSVSNPGGTVNLGNNTPLLGLFAAWNERLDGAGAEVKVSAAYGQKNTTINRSVVGSGAGASEAGSGSSTLNSQGVQATAKYGFGIMDNVIVSPYVGVRYTQNNMGGYTEGTSSSVTAPLTYSALNTNATTALAGVGASYRVIPDVTTFASAGVETDTNTANGTYSATNASIGTLTPINFNPNPVKTRPTATVGAYYDIEKNQRVGITGIYRQEAYQAVSTTTVMATYTIGL